MNDLSLYLRRAKQQLAQKWVNVAIGSLIYVIFMLILGSTYVLELIFIGPLTFGYFLYVACIVDTGANNLNLLFKGFDRFVETLVAGLLYSLAVGIGFALLIVPGIIAACGLGMTFYIMVDNPNVTGLDALQQSWNMMKGHKMEFFILQLHFIGWMLLAILTCGIGLIFLEPYMVATNLNYYRKLRYGTF